MADLRLAGLTKSYGALRVVAEIDLDVADGEFVVLVGPSGCGKSTILRMVAGLEDATAGDILIGGRRVNDLPARERNLAMVFQDYALYPHMSVAANIGFGLRMRGVPRAAREARVAEVARLLQLDGLLDRRPAQLSGGQRQRVAMGRAMARQAALFLFDEPLSNLDAKLRLELRTQIRLLHRALGQTSVFVTHDQVEAMTLADRIVCLEAGRVAQIGTPDELYNRPASAFVAGFIGSPPINLLPAEACAGRLVLACGQSLPAPPGPLPARVLVGLRPEDLTDDPRRAAEGPPVPLTAEAVLTEALGADSFLLAGLGGQRVTARIAPGPGPAPGAPVTLYADAGRLHLFDPGSGRRL
jgi:ABC-type sugar transport system ATPase subunit